MLSHKTIKTGADLYYDPSYTGTNISSSITDLATAKTAFTALEALTWESLGMLSALTVSIWLENAQEVNALNCGVGTLSDLAYQFARINPTLLECKNFDLWADLLGWESYTDGSTPFWDFYTTSIKQKEVKQGRFRIVSCPYQTWLATAGKEWARDYYFLEKASLDWEVLMTFLNKWELPTGAQFILNGKTGGNFFVHTEYAATEWAL